MPNLKTIATILANFNLWMFRGGVDTFVLVTIFLNEVSVPMHVTMELFEVHETFKQSMAIQLQSLLEKYGFLHQVITFLKDEGSNLTIMVAII